MRRRGIWIGDKGIQALFPIISPLKARQGFLLVSMTPSLDQPPGSSFFQGDHPWSSWSSHMALATTAGADFGGGRVLHLCVNTYPKVPHNVEGLLGARHGRVRKLVCVVEVFFVFTSHPRLRLLARTNSLSAKEVHPRSPKKWSGTPWSLVFSRNVCQATCSKHLWDCDWDFLELGGTKTLATGACFLLSLLEFRPSRQARQYDDVPQRCRDEHLGRQP